MLHFLLLSGGGTEYYRQFSGRTSFSHDSMLSKSSYSSFLLCISFSKAHFKSIYVRSVLGCGAFCALPLHPANGVQNLWYYV